MALQSTNARSEQARPHSGDRERPDDGGAHRIFSCPRRNLADLADPHHLAVTPVWFRVVMVVLFGFAAVAVVMGLVVYIDPTIRDAGLGAKEVVIGVAVFAVGAVAAVWVLKPFDGARWIEFAATPEGLYLPGRARTAVFIPWSSVESRTVKRKTSERGEISWLELGLRLSDADLVRFSRLSRPIGDHPVRTQKLKSTDLTGDEIDDCLAAYADGELSKTR